MASVLQAFFVWIERLRGTGPRTTVGQRQSRLPIGDLIKVLADLENGEAHFSIDMQVLADLKKVPV